MSRCEELFEREAGLREAARELFNHNNTESRKALRAAALHYAELANEIDALEAPTAEAV